MREVATQTAAAFDARATVEFVRNYPPTINHPESPRVLRRLHFLRECSHEQDQQVFP